MNTRRYYRELHVFELIEYLNKEYGIELTDYQKSKIRCADRTWLYRYGELYDKEEKEEKHNRFYYIKEFLIRLIGIPTFFIASMLFRFVICPILFILTGKDSYYFIVTYKKGAIGHFFEKCAIRLNLL